MAYHNEKRYLQAHTIITFECCMEYHFFPSSSFQGRVYLVGLLH